MQTEIEIVNSPAEAATVATEVAPVKVRKVRKAAKPKKIRGVTTDRSTIGGKFATTEGRPLKVAFPEPYFSDEDRKTLRRHLRKSRLAGGNRDANPLFRTHKLHDRWLLSKSDEATCRKIAASIPELAKKLVRASKRGESAKVAAPAKEETAA